MCLSFELRFVAFAVVFPAAHARQERTPVTLSVELVRLEEFGGTAGTDRLFSTGIARTACALVRPHENEREHIRARRTLLTFFLLNR